MRQGFFQVVSRREFLELLGRFPAVGTEAVPLEDALHRVLARDVVPEEDLPPAPRSCMDGFAVAASDTFGASEQNPGYLELAGDVSISAFPDFSLPPGGCARIPTGGWLPAGADAVVMVEHTQEMGAGTVEVRKAVAPGDHVMLRGEDAVAGEAALLRGTRLRPQELGLLAALGRAEVPVFRRPRAAVLSTGDELTPVSAAPGPGRIRDINSHTVAALARLAGAQASPLGIAPDDLAALTEALAAALADHDAVFLSGGSSVGVRDHTIEALSALGAEVLAHGVSISPGKPTILARLGDKAVLGLPGQAASAQVVMTVLGDPLLRVLSGETDALTDARRPRRRAVLARNTASTQGREDFVRVALEERPGGLPLARPVLGKSGFIRTLVKSHGLAVIPAEAEGLYAGTEVEVILL